MPWEEGRHMQGDFANLPLCSGGLSRAQHLLQTTLETCGCL